MNLPLIAPYIRLLTGNRQYRWLWFSQVVSLTGDWFNLIATTTLVAQLSRSGLAISGIFLARLLPPFLLGPVVGVVADRFDRKKILIASDLLRMAVVLGFLRVRSESDLWLLYGLILLQLSISAFFEPTRSALMPAIVPRKDLVTANALDSTTWSTMLAVGAALGGLATATLGISAAFIIDALTFAASAWCVWHLHPPREDFSVTAGQSSFTNYVDGLRYLWHRPHTLALTLVKAAAALSFGAIDIVQVEFAEKIFPVGNNSSGTLGIIYTAIGIGTGLAPLLAQKFTGERQNAMRRGITVAFVMSAIGFFGVAWSPTLWILLLATVIRTGGSGIAWVYSSALLQMRVPSAFRGRVFAFDLAAFTLASGASTFWGGYALDRLGLAPREVAFWCGVVGIVTLTVWAAYHHFQQNATAARPTAS